MTTDIIAMPENSTAALILADGSVFFGYGIGKPATSFGEICFNTSMTGYQEILSDPSYSGQIITFTFPHIGNIGTNKEDIESKKPAVRGLVIRENITAPSNFRSDSHLNDYLVKHKITGICGIDTRALTRNIRVHGAQNAAICYFENKTDLNIPNILKQLQGMASLKGMELAKGVACKESYKWNEAQWKLGSGYGKADSHKYKVVAIDYGAKLNILRCLTELGCDVTVVPADTKAEDIIKMKPDGIFLSNGPGDPAATGQYALPELKKLIETGLPIFGICLGHQLLALAMGCTTTKMHQGHRGGNHPVQDLYSKKVEITSQNHGFVVTKNALPDDVEITHLSLFDDTIEGIKHKTKPVFSVQYHPESSPGPHDSYYLFERFVGLMGK